MKRMPDPEKQPAGRHSECADLDLSRALLNAASEVEPLHFCRRIADSIDEMNRMFIDVCCRGESPDSVRVRLDGCFEHFSRSRWSFLANLPEFDDALRGCFCNIYDHGFRFFEAFEASDMPGALRHLERAVYEVSDLKDFLYNEVE